MEAIFLGTKVFRIRLSPTQNLRTQNSKKLEKFDLQMNVVEHKRVKIIPKFTLRI